MNHPLSRKINVVDLISWRPSYNSLNLCLIMNNVDILFTFKYLKYLDSLMLGQSLKGTVVNLKCHFANGGSLKITSSVPLRSAALVDTRDTSQTIL